MPSDVLGTTVFNMKTNGFDFHQGPIFADIVLVDEINRAPAKTQAALFEVMEERQVSIDGTTPPDGGTLYDSGYSEPGGAGGDIQTSRSAARPFSDEDNDGLSFAGREVNILERHHTNAALVKLEDVTPYLLQRRTSFSSCLDEPGACRPYACSIYRVDCAADSY